MTGAPALRPPGWLDPQRIEQLRLVETPEEPGRFVRLLELYLRSSAAWFEQLRTAATNDDPEGVVRAAHDLRSSSDAVGARTLAVLAGQIEVQARSSGTSPPRGRIEALALEQQAVAAAVRTLIALEPAPPPA